MTLASAASEIGLPDDFGGFEGQITLTSSSGTHPMAIRLYNEGQIDQAFAASPDASGVPQMAALRPLKGTTGKSGQRMSLYFYPEADAAYTVKFAYHILPDFLTGSTPYAYGGAAHVETILESCLAIAEQRLDDALSVHSAKFQERLVASIGIDRRNKAQTLGMNLDRSDAPGFRDRGDSTIMYSGVQY